MLFCIVKHLSPQNMTTISPSTFSLSIKKKHRIGINLKCEMLYNYWKLKWEKNIYYFLLILKSVINFI